MCAFRWFFRWSMLLLAVICAPTAWAAADNAVVGVRVGKHQQTTRFVIDLAKQTEFRVFTLPDPYRVVIDLPRAQWDAAKRGRLPRAGLITAYRFGQFTPGNMRLVLDVKTPTIVRKAFLLEPKGKAGHRLVIDLEPVSRADYREKTKRRGQIASLKPPGALPKPAPPVRKAPRKAGEKRVVVIDAGHGGIDPGTIGARGTREKIITLRIARELRKQLEATGRYKVRLTRSDDFVVPLRERIAIARRAGAELFLSLHADSIRKRSIRGASVYTLSETASDKEAAALAKKENKADVIAGVDLGVQDRQVANILIDLAQRETMNFSARFATILIKELGKDVKLLRRTHRFAGFAVLKAPDVASVLVELGYLSNPVDESLLRKPSHRAKVARAIVRAINKYFDLTDRLSRT